MAMSPLLQYAVGALAPFLIADFALSRTQIGLFTTVMFLTAAVGSPWLGGVADRLGGRRVLFALFVLSGISAVVLASARSYGWILAAALIVSLPMAVANPVTNLLVRGRLPSGRRGLMMGVKQSGVKVAQALAGIALPPLALAWGWRSAMWVVVGMAAVGVMLTASTVQATRVDHESRSGTQILRPLPSAVRWLAAFALCMGIGQSAIGSYLPLYGFEGVGLNEAAAGVVAGMAGIVGAISRTAWGPVAERIRSITVPLQSVAVGSAVATALLLSASVIGPTALVVGSVAFGATAPVWNVIGMLAIFRLVDSTTTGRATGFVFLGFSLGFVVGPVLFGLAVDYSGTYALGWLGVIASFFVALLVTFGISRTVRPDSPMTTVGSP